MKEEEEELFAEQEVEDLGLHRVTNDTVQQRNRQLMLVYLVFLGEAIMASSLQPQLQMLISENDSCGNLSTSYLRSILDCAYAFGGTVGIFWGHLSDRMGRRRVTLLGLWSMFICCLTMGFATDLASCTIFRFFAGMVSSTIVVASLTMIGDLSSSMQDRVRNVAKLPLISLFGSVGPLLQGMVPESLQAYGAVWSKFPTLGSELACGTIIFGIALLASMMLKETLPLQSEQSDYVMDVDCEKAAFLAQTESDELSISVVDSVRPDPITITQFMQAPSLLVLLSSFSLLSLHAATFDVLLPHLGHSETRMGGMGIPCTWLGYTVLIMRGIAGWVILYVTPRAIEKYGLLKLYRTVSLCFPAVYVVTPILAMIAACAAGFVPIVSTLSILVKHTLAGSASVLVALLVLNTTPDAYSSGTVVGMMQVASLFKAFAVAVSGMSYYVSSEVSVETTNMALWTFLALFGAAGAGLAVFVREHATVGGDLPNEVLQWETCFDAESDSERSSCETDR